ncbi:MAG: HD domain-containing phosphohydrolase [Candidatus Velthaea sp.]
MNRVLVVDDHETNLKLYARVVSKIPNAQPVSFLSAKAALKWAELNDVALALVDQQMPELSGVEFIKLFRQLRGRADVPIIMITGNTDRELRREALQSGAGAFLTKPVDPVEFLAVAQNFIAARSTRVEAAARADAAQGLVRSLTASLEARDVELIEMLERLMQARDKRLAEHCKRTALYATIIARKLGLSVIDVNAIALAARVHDVGKVTVADRVLYKPSRLSEPERAAVQAHAAAAGTLLKDRESPILALAAQIATHHHEHVDGTGYPSGLRGDAIPEAARIVAVADAFSALTSRRPYREALSVGIALDEIDRDAGTHFERRIAAALRDSTTEILEARALVPDSAPD